MQRTKEMDVRVLVCVCVCVCVGHLEHKSTHAEDHAEQVHVVRCGVLQCWVGLCAGRFVPVTAQTYFKQDN